MTYRRSSSYGSTTYNYDCWMFYREDDDDDDQDAKKSFKMIQNRIG